VVFDATNEQVVALALIENSGLKWNNPRDATDTAIDATILYKTGKIEDALGLARSIDWNKVAVYLKPYLLKYWGDDSPIDPPNRTF
jgi:hypothetical protein